MFGTDDDVDFRQTLGIHGMYTVCRKGCWGVLFGFNNRECGTLDFCASVVPTDCPKYVWARLLGCGCCDFCHERLYLAPSTCPFHLPHVLRSLTIFRTWHSSRVPLEPTYSKIRNANLVNSILFRNGNRTGGSHLPTGSLACPAINDGRTYPELRLITQNKTLFRRFISHVPVPVVLSRYRMFVLAASRCL